MPLFKYLRAFEKKFALGLILAIGGTLLAIYTDFFREQRPNLKYEILSNTPVLDIHEQLGSLSILYGGKDIRQTGQSLYVITLRVVNDGRADILMGSYDDGDPLGFALPPTAFVERAEVLDASNDYLRRNVSVDIQHDASGPLVVFRKVILEHGESFIVKVLVLQSGDSEIPPLAPMGKVAGVKRTEITYPYRQSNQISFWGQTFGGGAVIQITRAVSYTIATVVLLILFGLAGTFISDKLDDRKRNRLVQSFRESFPGEINDDNEALLQIFINEGDRPLYRMESYLLIRVDKKHDMHKFRTVVPRIADRLVELKIIEKTGADWNVVEPNRMFFDSFISFLRANKRLRYSDVAHVHLELD